MTTKTIDYGKLFEGLENVQGFDSVRASTLIESHIASLLEAKDKEKQDELDEMKQKHEEEKEEMKESHLSEVADLKESAELFGDHQKHMALEESAHLVESALSTFMGDWAESNAPILESNIKVKLAENLFAGLGDLMEGYNITIPEGEDLTESTNQLNESLDQEIAARINLENELKESKREADLLNGCIGLTLTECDRVRKLSEAFEYDDTFAERVKTLRESVESNDPLNTSGGGEDTSLLENHQKQPQDGQTITESATVNDTLAFMRRNKS